MAPSGRQYRITNSARFYQRRWTDREQALRLSAFMFVLLFPCRDNRSTSVRVGRRPARVFVSDIWLRQQATRPGARWHQTRPPDPVPVGIAGGHQTPCPLV